MEITNFDLDPIPKDKRQNHWLLPNSICCLICSPPGCGKTNLLLNPILKKNYLTLDRLHIYSKSLGQDKHQFLKDCAEAFGKVVNKEIASFHSSSDDILPVEDLDKNERSVMIFDDVMLDKQGAIEKYFCQGCHVGAGCLYLTQNYCRLPKQAIKDNSN